MASELHWKDLTDEQKERLLAVSRGEQAHNPIVYQLAEFGAVEIEGEYAYLFITPFGGALLAERDKLLTNALAQIANSEWCIYERNGASEYGKGVTDGHRAAAMIARDALAAVAKERGE